MRDRFRSDLDAGRKHIRRVGKGTPGYREFALFDEENVSHDLKISPVTVRDSRLLNEELRNIAACNCVIVVVCNRSEESESRARDTNDTVRALHWCGGG